MWPFWQTLFGLIKKKKSTLNQQELWILFTTESLQRRQQLYQATQI